MSEDPVYFGPGEAFQKERKSGQEASLTQSIRKKPRVGSPQDHGGKYDKLQDRRPWITPTTGLVEGKVFWQFIVTAHVEKDVCLHPDNSV